MLCNHSLKIFLLDLYVQRIENQVTTIALVTLASLRRLEVTVIAPFAVVSERNIKGAEDPATSIFMLKVVDV